jgi:23S rRNA (uracil1939-C5)-methyltransferase
VGQELTLQLTDMAHGGEAVGRYEGKVVFVPFGIPGELVRAEIVQDKGRFAHARLTKVLSASPQRVEPPCPYFGVCGGCQWQHLAYAAQLEHKRSIVQAQLERIAGLADATVHPTLGMTEPWQYRNHVQFSVSDEGQLGFMAANSHQVIPIQRCLLMHRLLDELFEAMDIDLPGLRRLSLRAGIRTDEQMIIFEMESDHPPALEVDLPVSCVLLLSDGTAVTLVGSPHIHERVANRTYRLSAPSFFQVNTAQAEALVSLVSEYLSPGPDDTVVDAYCGVGTFALSLAGRAKQVIGIESNAAAIADAHANASSTDCAAAHTNVSFLCGLVEEILPTLQLESPLLVVDPPRTGLDRRALLALLSPSGPSGQSRAPERIVYVSCDPATLARDVKALLAHGYVLREVQPVDMFPQTYHIENVAVFVRA